MAKQKIEVQNGPIVAHQPTMKTKLRNEVEREDARDRAGRRDGMILKLHEPKR